jgi:cytochrome c553
MTDVAKGMSNDDLRTYSEIVSRLPPPRPPAAAPDAPRIARGQSVAEKHQCGTCHQPDYAGRENVPRVANQREDYLLKVLREYKTGKRVGYGNAVMPETVSGLSDADLQDVAHFLAYRPPRP